MIIRIDNKIYIHEPSSAIIAYCKKNLMLDNPDYYKMQKLGKWTGNTPKQICLYERDGEDLILPFGCLRDVWNMHPVQNDYVSDIEPIQKLDYQSNIDLYPYQEDAVCKAVRAKNGVLVMPCGSGKTVCGLEIISRIGGRALWLTHTQDLLTQSKQRAESVLSLGLMDVGIITAGKVSIGKKLTIATVQTMAKIDLRQYGNAWDVIIVDECHHAVSCPSKITMFGKVLSGLSARYKFGLTATPKRADGLERAMFALLGDKICEVTKEDVAHTTCPVKVNVVQTDWMPDYDAVLMGDGTLDYAKLVDNMIHSEERFEKVMDVINAIPHANPVMVLANRIEYLQDMLTNYEKTGVCLSGQGQSKKAKAERKEALERLNNGEIDAVFASYKLAAEGLDCPNLRYIVFATPEKNDATVTQATGRVGRKADGKSYGTVIDFVDEFGLYKGFYKERLKVYKKLNCDIIE